MKNIAILAHDKMKPLMAEFIKEREEWLWGRVLVATGRSASFLEEANFKVPIQHMKPGQSGGYEEITDMVRKNEMALVLFFVDPDVKEKHHPDIENLIDACIRHNVPLATNTAGAELLILGLIRKEASERVKPK
jgi:methylglyoxal synthase